MTPIGQSGCERQTDGVCAGMQHATHTHQELKVLKLQSPTGVFNLNTPCANTCNAAHIEELSNSEFGKRQKEKKNGPNLDHNK